MSLVVGRVGGAVCRLQWGVERRIGRRSPNAVKELPSSSAALHDIPTPLALLDCSDVRVAESAPGSCTSGARSGRQCAS